MDLIAKKKIDDHRGYSHNKNLDRHGSCMSLVGLFCIKIVQRTFEDATARAILARHRWLWLHYRIWD